MAAAIDAVRDERFLRRAFEVARRAREHGNHPFGAVLVDAAGVVLLEMENCFQSALDMTAHAERLLATEASQKWRPPFLGGCTLYSSAELCAMCAGAIYWSGIGRVVYGLGERRLKAITGDDPENPTLDLPCRVVFAAGQRRIDVSGPLPPPRAAAVHEGAWGRQGSHGHAINSRRGLFLPRPSRRS
jgi:tRNA(Arg) A34 adenosine deaminase TadA